MEGNKKMIRGFCGNMDPQEAGSQIEHPRLMVFIQIREFKIVELPSSEILKIYNKYIINLESTKCLQPTVCD